MKIPYNWLKEYLPKEATSNLNIKEVANKLTMMGHALDKPIFDQGGDTVMDLEDRGNRADVTGVIGIARDLAAVLNTQYLGPKTQELPKTDNKAFPIKIDVDSKRVIRWRALVYKNLTIGESPQWIKNRLLSYGIEPKNNVVDLTNFVMIETGMPSHAFDSDKLDKIILRQARLGETLKTFDGGTLEFDENDLLAASSTKPLTLTTAVGGEESGISFSTKNILIEAGLYDQPTARKSALRLNVRNETSGRLGKYLHPELCQLAIERIAYLMKEVLGAEPENTSFDYYPTQFETKSIILTQKRLDVISGSHIRLIDAEEILIRLGFLIEGLSDNELVVKVPYFRTDVTMEDDVIEEVLRIRGYDKIPSIMIERPVPKKLVFKEMDMEEEIKDIGSRLGFNEVISLQMVDLDEVVAIGAANEKGDIDNELDGKRSVVRLENSWNKELNVLRSSIFESMYVYAGSYYKHHVEKIKLLETGKTYFVNKEKTGFEKYEEIRRLGLLSNMPYLELKAEVEALLVELGIVNYNFKKINHFLYKQNISAGIWIDNLLIGVIGEVRDSILNSLKVGTKLSFCELNILPLTINSSKGQTPKPKTQMDNWMSEDFTLSIPSEKYVGEMISEITHKLPDKVKLLFKDVYKNNETPNIKKVTITIRSSEEHLISVRNVLNNYRI